MRRIPGTCFMNIPMLPMKRLQMRHSCSTSSTRCCRQLETCTSINRSHSSSFERRTMPKPLLHKLIAQAAVGFFFLSVGCVYGIHSKDYIFIILSLFIGLCSLIHTCSFYRLIHKGAYRVLSGTCIRQTSTPFKKDRQIVLVDETQREYRLTLDKNSGLLPGHHYRWYYVKKKYKLKVNFSYNLPFFIQPIFPSYSISVHTHSRIHLVIDIHNDCGFLPYYKMSLCIQIPIYRHVHNFLF